MGVGRQGRGWLLPVTRAAQTHGYDLARVHALPLRRPWRPRAFQVCAASPAPAALSRFSLGVAMHAACHSVCGVPPAPSTWLPMWCKPMCMHPQPALQAASRM